MWPISINTIVLGIIAIFNVVVIVMMTRSLCEEEYYGMYNPKSSTYTKCVVLLDICLAFIVAYIIWGGVNGNSVYSNTDLGELKRYELELEENIRNTTAINTELTEGIQQSTVISKRITDTSRKLDESVKSTVATNQGIGREIIVIEQTTESFDSAIKQLEAIIGETDKLYEKP